MHSSGASNLSVKAIESCRTHFICSNPEMRKSMEGWMESAEPGDFLEFGDGANRQAIVCVKSAKVMKVETITRVEIR